MKKLSSKLITAFVLTFAVTGAFSLNYQKANAAGVSVWWPTNNAQVAGTQPFKARIDGMNLSDYSMYWQVDNGQLNSMSDNNTDAPHKEASVDLSSWHWQPSGTYQVNFVAKDKNGNTIATQPVTIITNKSASVSVSAPAPVVAQPTKPAAVTPPLIVSTPSTGNSNGGTQTSISPAPVVSTSNNMSIWWPTDGTHMTGVQPFKAILDNQPLGNYSMYWQVDGGKLNAMSDNFNGGGHKEATVDLTNWKWHGSGPYSITVVAKDHSGNQIASKTVKIYVDGQTASAPVVTTPSVTSNSTPVVTNPAPAPTPVPTPSPAPSATPDPVSTGSSRSGDPLSGANLYVDPNSTAAVQAKAWATSNPSGAALMTKIATQPVGKWFGGWNANIQADSAAYVNAAASSNSVPVLIAYNVPFRDCGGYSAGGATTADAYNAWIKGMAQGIGSNKAVVILEPDGLANIDCLSQSEKDSRYVMLQNAISTLKANKNTMVYIDAGNSNWISANDMAPRLKNAGIALADGFALNVSNFYATSDLTSFGNQLSPLVNGKHFVIDTSRNGNGPNGSEWCNPAGRALGQKPTANTGSPLVDAFLWLKTPGESDGNCNGGPSAGVWWPEYAVGLAQRAAY